jgi:hypothetical protein
MPPTSQDHHDTRPIVRKTSIAVAVLGAIQLVLGNAAAPPGAVFLNVAGLVAAALILAGSTRVLIVMRWLALFALAPVVLNFLASVAIVPAGFALTQLRLYPAGFALVWGQLAVSAAMVCVTVAGLSHPRLRAAWADAGRKGLDRRIPLVLGLVLGIAGSVLMVRGLHGDDAERAREYAAARMGAGYSYYTERIDLQYGAHVTVFAIVQAWNEKGIVTVPVRWERQSVSR